MTPEQFQVVKKESIEAADNIVTTTVNHFGASLGWTHVQIVGIRLLASVIGNEMHNTGKSFEDCSEKLLNGLKKECGAIIEEIQCGEREGVQDQ